jgi:hypothetical protein
MLQRLTSALMLCMRAQLAAARESAAQAGAEARALQGRLGGLERQVSISSPSPDVPYC